MTLILFHMNHDVSKGDISHDGLFFRAPPVTLLPEARYDEVMTAFGGRGFLVRTVEELHSALQLSLSEWEKPSLLNVLIDPSSDRKQQVTVTGRQNTSIPQS